MNEIEASLEDIIFYNDSTRYLVGLFYDLKNRQIFTANGRMENPCVDEEYVLSGEVTTHKKYGEQFSFVLYRKRLPTNEAAIVRFLSSSRFKGIGPKTAQLVYETLGEGCLEQIAKTPDILSQIQALKPKQVQAILDGLLEYGDDSSVYLKLVEMGLPDRQIQLLLDAYESDLMEIIQENPFLPYYKVLGFGYRSALKLADGFQVPANDISRLDAMINEECRRLSFDSGSTYVTFKTLYDSFLGLEPAVFEASLDRLAKRKALTIVSQRCYPFGLYEEERDIARLLRRHMYTPDEISHKKIDNYIEVIEKCTGISYAKAQKDAMHQIFDHTVSILNGGPGTGKSTTVNGMLQLIRQFYPDAVIQLAAPTGRAAKRLATLTNMDARTIHSLLRWNKDDNTFAVSEYDPLEADFLIVDECSMVDTHLFASLLKGLRPGCRILLIGDEDQLESVGPGKVFNDIIDSGLVPITRLTEIFRQKHGSGIVSLAEQVREDKQPEYEDGVTFLELPAAEVIETLAEEYDVSAGLEEVQILAPKYRGQAGIDVINQAIQKLVNPPAPGKSQVRSGNVTFRKGDKVMLLKNKPDEEVYNGDIGIISSIDAKDGTIHVMFGGNLVSFDSQSYYLLSLAYCISVHKAQGSEFAKVWCVVCGEADFMMNKRLLYTAVSRAKKELVLLGSPSVFEERIRTESQIIRHTTLKDAMKAFWKASAATRNSLLKSKRPKGSFLN